MRRSPASWRQERLLDEALARMPRQDDPDLLLALACRRCPRCGSYLFREPPDRTFCLTCSWEWYGAADRR